MRVFLVFLIAAANAQTPEARIKIDIDRQIGEVDPLLFGNFAEHLGRMIYGEFMTKAARWSDADGYRKDVMEAVKKLGVSILRYPGGNFSSGYDWKDGIGPKDQRPVRMENKPGTTWRSNRFGTDGFLHYCRAHRRTKPYFVYQRRPGNGGRRASLGRVHQRIAPHLLGRPAAGKNGHDGPYNVKYWGLGNEIDGPWQLGHKTAEEYAKFAVEATKAMRLVDKNVMELVASGSMVAPARRLARAGIAR